MAELTFDEQFRATSKAVDEALGVGGTPASVPLAATLSTNPATLSPDASFDERFKFYSDAVDAVKSSSSPITASPTPTPVDHAGADDASVVGSFFGGIGEEFSTLRTLGTGVAALGADALGFEDVSSSLIDTVLERQAAAEERYAAEGYVSFQDVKDAEGAWESTKAFTKWLAFATGEQIPNIATIIAGGGVGKLIGEAVAKKAITTKAAELAGAYAASVGIETGATAVEQISSGLDLNPGVALMAGIAKGALESVTPLALGKASGLLGTQNDELAQLLFSNMDKAVARFAVTGAKVGLVEGATEITQEAVDITARAFIDENYSWASPEVKDRLVEAGVTALLTAGLIGGTTGVVTGKRAQGDPASTTPVDLTAVADVVGEMTSQTDATDSTVDITVPEGSLGDLLQTNSPDLSPVTFPTDATVLAPVYVSSKADVGNTPELLEFEAPDRAFFTAAERPEGSDPKAQVFVQAKDSIAGRDITAPVYLLPETLTVADKKVTLINEETAGEALGLAQEAVRKINNGEEASARETYRQAVLKGFRYKTDGKKGFTLVNNTEGLGGDLFVSSAPTSPLIKGKALRVLSRRDGFSTLSSEQAVTPSTKSNIVRSEFIDEGNLTEISLSPIYRKIGLTGQEEAATIVGKLQVAIDNGQVTMVLPEGVSLLDVVEANNTPGATRALQTKGLRFRSKGSSTMLLHVGELQDKAVKAVDAIVTNKPFNTTLAPVNIKEGSDVSRSSVIGNQFTLLMQQIGLLRLTDYKVRIKGKEQTIKIDNPKEMADIRAERQVTIMLDTNVKTVEDRKKARIIENMMNKLHAKFAKHTDLLVVITNTQENSSAGFHYSEDPSGVSHTIMLNLPFMDDNSLVRSEFKEGKRNFEVLAPSYASIAAHEFGHLLSSAYLGSSQALASGLTTEIVSAYHRWVYRVNLLSSLRETSRGLSPQRGLLVLRRPVEAGGKFDLGWQTQEYKDYIYSMEEWIAEQTVDYLGSTESITATDTFFKWFANKMKAVYTYAQKILGIKDIAEVTSAFESLIDYTQQQAQTSPQVFNLEKSLNKLRNAQTVWNEALGVHIDKGKASMGKRAVTNIPTVMSKVNLSKKVESGRTVKQELEIQSDAADYFSSVVKWGWNVLQLAKKNPHIQHLQDYVGVADLWQNEKNKWQSLANDTIRSWRGLGKERSGKLGKLLFALDSMEYLSEGENPRNPTKDELQAMVKKYDIDAATFVVFSQVRSDFLAMLERLEEVTLGKLRDSLTDVGPILLLEEQKIKKEFAALRNKPYFPHSRFGDYSIIVKDSKKRTVYMEQFESSVTGGLANFRGKTPKAVLTAAQEMKSDFPASEGFVIAIAKVPENVQTFQGMPPAVIARIQQTLSESLTDAQHDWLSKLAIDYAPTKSFRRRLQKRANTAGFSQDAMRSYANYFWHGSNHLARITYGSDMQDVIGEFRNNIKGRINEGFNVASRVRMADFLQDHLDTILNPKPDWAQLRSIAFTWWIGFSPASAALNFTQIPLVTVPYLSAHFGDVKTLSALRKAAFNLRRSYGDPAEVAKKWTDADGKLIGLGMEQGIFKESLATELAGTAEGSNILRARQGSAIQRGMAGFAHASGWLFQGSEEINRRVTFNAAVELARQNPDAQHLTDLRGQLRKEYEELTTLRGLSEIEASAFLAGKDAVRSTQYEYGAWAKPRFMRGKKGVIFTFYMFLQNTLWFAGNSPGNKRMLLTMLVMGGLMGLPGADDMQEVVEFIGRKLFGKRYKVDEEITKLVNELTGSPRAADLMLHGAGREGFGLPALGDTLGLPIPNFDMSASVGIGNVIPGLAQMLNNDTGSFEQTLGNTATDIAGASFGIGINMLKFLNDTQLPIDDMKRWERAMPRALKNVVRSMRYLPPDTDIARITGNFVEAEGRERTGSGSTLIAFEGDDPEHMMEIALQSIGFTPTRISREWTSIMAQSEVVNYWKLRRQILITQFWHSLYTKDPEERKDVLDAIMSFNKDAPDGAIAITRSTLQKSVKARTRRMLQQEAGIEGSKMFRGIAAEARGLYPNSTNTPESPDEATVINREVVK